MKKKILAALVCVTLVLAGPLAAYAVSGQSDTAMLETTVILTALRVPILKDGSFTAVSFTDETGAEISLPGDPREWFENAEFVRYSTPDPGGWLNGIYIDEDANEVLMVDGGDRMNFVFVIDGVEYEFSFGPGSQIAAQITETGFVLVPAETAALSPPQTEPIPAAYAARVD